MAALQLKTIQVDLVQSFLFTVKYCCIAQGYVLVSYVLNNNCNHCGVGIRFRYRALLSIGSNFSKLVILYLILSVLIIADMGTYKDVNTDFSIHRTF